MPEPDRTARPYKTIWDLHGLRDKIAHPKPIPFNKKFYHTDEEPPPSPHYAPYDELASGEKALRSLQDVQELIEAIQAAAGTKINDVWFSNDVIQSHAETFTTLAP